VKQSGPATPKMIREALGVPRRTITRLLAVLVAQNRLERTGDSQDPAVTYKAKINYGA
jgi:DNA-binding MarR family transcriptional regulator